MGFNYVEYELFKKHARNPVLSLAGTLDKKRFHVTGLEGFISYSTYGKLALAMAEPICPSANAGDMVLSFQDYCEKNGLHEIYFSSTHEAGNFLPSDLFTRICIGDEALVKLPFSGHSGKVRRMANRAANLGIRVRRLSTEEQKSREFTEASRAITEEWLKGKNSELIYFIVNNDFLDVQDHQIVFLAEKEGVSVGFLTAYGVPASNSVYMDITRISSSAPNGTSELMVNSLLEKMAGAGVSSVSLGMVPLSNLQRIRNNAFLDLVFHALFDYGNYLYPSKSELFFKKKFSPAWRPVFAYCSKKSGPADFYRLFRIFQPMGFRAYLRK